MLNIKKVIKKTYKHRGQSLPSNQSTHSGRWDQNKRVMVGQSKGWKWYWWSEYHELNIAIESKCRNAVNALRAVRFSRSAFLNLCVLCSLRSFEGRRGVDCYQLVVQINMYAKQKEWMEKMGWKEYVEK